MVPFATSCMPASILTVCAKSKMGIAKKLKKTKMYFIYIIRIEINLYGFDNFMDSVAAFE